MPVSVGDKLPQATFTTMTGDGPAQLSTADVFGGKKVVLFAVPGAFTPTCHMKHLPGFIAHAGDFRASGVDTVACTSVNDAFVLDAWAEQTGAKGKITFLADGNADFARACGLDMDGTPVGLGPRSQRYAMLVEDGVVKELLVEDTPKSAEISSAEKLLAAL